MKRLQSSIVSMMLALMCGWAAATPPDPESGSFLTVRERFTTGNESFNHLQRRTRAIEIAGMTVVIDPTTSKNKLYSLLNKQENIRTLSIYADKLIVRSSLELPQTTVRIYCRSLVFEDPVPATAGRPQIITTPAWLSFRPLPGGSGKPGATGLAAGDVFIYNESLTANVGNKALFNATGGAGQPGGLGRDGVRGADMPVYVGVPSLSGDDPGDTVYVYRKVYSQTNPEEFYKLTLFGKDQWPNDGEAGVPAGVPGTGGNGGKVRMRVNGNGVSALAGGGQSGEAGFITFGGPPGSPNPAHHYSWNWFPILGPHFYLEETHTAVNGKDSMPPKAARPTGEPDNYGLLAASEPTMHPNVLNTIHAYSFHLIAAHEKEAAATLLGDYLARYAQFKTTSHWTAMTADEKQEADKVAAEMETRRRQAVGNGIEHWGGYE